MSNRTLCFLVRGNPVSEILLGLKKTGFGAGKYAGFGGKIESGETVEDAAIRELEEEAGIKISKEDLCPMAHLTFEFPFKPSWSQVVHVFIAKTWTGNPKESDEMKPTWCMINEIPFGSMWDDAHYWLPIVAEGKRIDARFVYREDNETIGEAKIEQRHTEQSGLASQN